MSNKNKEELKAAKTKVKNLVSRISIDSNIERNKLPDNGAKNLLCFKPQMHNVAIARNRQVWVESTRSLLSTTRTNYFPQARLINIGGLRNN